MATGDVICNICGSYWCYGECTRRLHGKIHPGADDGFITGPGRARNVEVDKLADRVIKPPLAINPKLPKDMTQDDLESLLSEYMGDKVFAKRFAECITMLRSKNADYSQGEQKGDRIAAFRRIAKDVNISMKQAWAVFCQKHWGAVMKFVKEGTVESEPIDGRLNDIINYMVLLGAIIEDERK